MEGSNRMVSYEEILLMDELIQMDPTLKDINKMLATMQDINKMEGILGPNNLTMLQYVACEASDYLNNDNFDKCMEMLRHTMNCPREVHCSLNFSGVFITMYDVMSGRSNSVKCDCLSVFTRCVDVVEVLLEPHTGHTPQNILMAFKSFQKTLIKYFVLFVQLRPSMSEEDIDSVHRSLCRFIKLNLRDDYGCQLLHLVCRDSDPSFPLEEVVEVLLKAGANPQAVDCRGHTPLHWLAMNQHPSRRRVLKLLMSKCCCCGLNSRNAQKKLFTDYLPSEMLSDIGMPFDDLSLLCLSAKAVAKHSITHQSILPARLSEYVKMHLLCMCPVVYRDPRNFNHRLNVN